MAKYGKDGEGSTAEASWSPMGLETELDAPQVGGHVMDLDGKRQKVTTVHGSKFQDTAWLVDCEDGTSRVVQWAEEVQVWATYMNYGFSQ